MRKEHLAYISDPLDGTDLSLTIFNENDSHILDGILQSRDNMYPIINGIPRLLTGELKDDMLKSHISFLEKYKSKIPEEFAIYWESLYSSIVDKDAFMKHQRDTADSFAFEWNSIYQENKFEKDNFLHFLGGYKREVDFQGKIVLDVGSGSGRFTKMAALCGAKICFGADLSEAVEFSFKLTNKMENVCIVQADIYHLPFLHNIDLALSIGVLHHLPDPKGGFTAIAKKVLKTGKQFLIRVYARKNNKRALYLYEPVRAITNKMNKRLLLFLCHVPAFLVHLINMFTLLLKKCGLPQRWIEKIPFFYYTNFPYSMKLNDAFDVLATPKSNYYYTQDIETWYSDAGYDTVEARYLVEAGLTAMGTYTGYTTND